MDELCRGRPNRARTLGIYDRAPGLDGHSRQGSQILCTNPLTGGAGIAAPASANLGTLLPEATGNDAGPGCRPRLPAWLQAGCRPAARRLACC